jgi:hypothetical protein
MNVSEYDVLILKNGGRWDFWTSHVDVVRQFVDKHQQELTRVQVVGQIPVARATEPIERGAKAGHVLMWDPTRGGMRMPHLHYAGEILLLNQSQWAEFSAGAVAAVTARMTQAKQVTFESLMQVSEAMAGQ